MGTVVAVEEMPSFSQQLFSLTTENDETGDGVTDIYLKKILFNELQKIKQKNFIKIKS